MKDELRKLHMQKVIWLVLAVMFILNLILSFNGKAPSVFFEKDSYRYYQTLLNTYKGTLTDASYTSIQNLKNEVEDAKSQRAKIFDTLHNTDALTATDAKQIKQRLLVINELMKQEEAINKINRQAEYVNEHREQRQLMDETVWKQLLSQDTLNYPLIVCLLILNIYLFTAEYETDMRIISISSKHGKYRQFRKKCELALMLSMCFTIVFLLTENLFLFLQGDYSMGHAPMQSIEAFAKSPFNMSCIHTWLCIKIVQLLGYLSFSCALWVMAVQLKRFLSATVIAAVLLLMVQLFLPQPYVYSIPTPVSLMRGSGFFRGDEQIIVNKGTTAEFTVVSYSGGYKVWEISMLLCCLLLIVGGVYWSYKSYGNLHRKRKISIKKVALFVLVLLLCACTEKEQLSDTQSAEPTVGSSYYQNGFLYIKQNDIYYFDGNKTARFIQADEFRTGDILYMDSTEHGVCFLDREQVSDQQKYAVKCYNDANRGLQSVYEQKTMYKTQHLFNLVTTYLQGLEDVGSDTSLTSFFIRGQALYLIDGQSHLMRVDENGEIDILLSDYSANAVLTEHILYYVSTNLDLCAYDLQKKTLTIMNTDLVNQLISFHDELYFTMFNQQGVYQVVRNKTKKLTAEAGTLLAVSKNYIYMQDTESRKVFLIDRATNEKRYSNIEDIVMIQVKDDDLLIMRELHGESSLYLYDERLLKGRYIDKIF